MPNALKNIAHVSGYTLISRLSGLLRDILMFAYLGNTWMTSALVFAFTLPNLFRRLLGEGALTSAFIPMFTDALKHQDTSAAFRFLNASLKGLFYVCLGLCCCLMLGLESIQLIGNLQNKWSLGCRLSTFLLPYMICICLAALMSASLNALNRFTLAALSQVWLNICMIISFIAGHYMFPNAILSQIYLVCGAILIGGGLQMVTSALALKQEGWNYEPKTALNADVSKLFMLALPGIAGAAILQVNTVVSRLIAFKVDAKGISELYLANRLLELPLGMFTISVITVLFPKLAASVSRKDSEALRTLYKQGFAMLVAVSLPAAIGLVLLGDMILKLFFEWGRFGAHDSSSTAPLLSILAIGLPIYSLSILFTRIFHAHKSMKIPAKLAALGFVINVVLALLLQTVLNLKGLALANVITAILQCIGLYYILSRTFPELRSARIWPLLFQVLIASIIMSFYIFGARSIGCHWFQMMDKFELLVALILIIPSSILIYTYILYKLKFEALKELRTLFARKFSKRTHLKTS